MRKWILTGALCAASGLAFVSAGAQAATMKLSQAECQTMWKQADSSGSGSLSQTQASAYVTDFKSVDANGDGKLSSAEFQKGCDNGMVKSSASTGAGSGSSGSSTDSPASSGSGSSTAPPKQQY